MTALDRRSPSSAGSGWRIGNGGLYVLPGKLPRGASLGVANENSGGAPAPVPSEPTRVLVVEDDATLRTMIADFLRAHDVETVLAASQQEMARHLAAREPDLILLDLRLGQDGGLDVLRQIRAQSDVPVIITTGHRRDEIDRVVGLELGADDYILKPFGLRELLARIRAVLRRCLAASQAQRLAKERGKLRFAGWQLDRRARTLADPEGASVFLTKGEYNLLNAFLEAPQRPLQREHLLRATRLHEDIFDRSIDVQVLRLRRKLEPQPNVPRMIETLRGVGYIFTQAVETA